MSLFSSFTLDPFEFKLGDINQPTQQDQGAGLSALINQLDPEDQALIRATSGGDIARLLNVDPSAAGFFSPSEFNIPGLQAQGAEELGDINVGFGLQRGGLLSSLAGGARQIGQQTAASGLFRSGAAQRSRIQLGQRAQQQLGGLQLGRRQDIQSSQRGLLDSLLATIAAMRQRAAGFEQGPTPATPDVLTATPGILEDIGGSLEEVLNINVKDVLGGIF